jgi:hypothetical protein
MNPKSPLKYRLKIQIDEHAVALKPFVLNTFGSVCLALTSELNDIPNFAENPQIIYLEPSSPTKTVKLQIGGKDIEIKEFVQDMICKTLIGLLSTLQGVPERYEEFLKSNIMIHLSARTEKNN